MSKKKMAFDRIEEMGDQGLNDYIATLEQDLSVKQTKEQRLADDIKRHKKILEVARNEATQRGTSSSYRGREPSVS